jgi:hypothetical protein
MINLSLMASGFKYLKVLFGWFVVWAIILLLEFNT